MKSTRKAVQQTNGLAISSVKLIHESPHYIAVYKPAYTICQDEPGNPSSLSNVLRKVYPRLFEPRPSPFHAPKGCHRLDALVTGCVLYGMSVNGTRQLATNFQKRKVEKGYLALLSKIPGKDSVLDRANTGIVETEERTTHWTVLARLQKSQDVPCVYVCWLRPFEGRNHQLRLHAAENLNAPVIFDKRYTPDSSPEGESLVGIKENVYRQGTGEGIALHCASMKFPLGLKKQWVSCTPPDTGIWKQVADEFDIDWPSIVDRGANDEPGNLERGHIVEGLGKAEVGEALGVCLPHNEISS